MPDHLHLFCSPRTEEFTLESWIKFWKSLATRSFRTHGLIAEPDLWQAGHWDTRLRNDESYEGKWAYVRNNPVRAGLVTKSDDWPYQGEVVRLEWHGG
ncbi:MAG: hypothetical protein SFV23_23815 [Planctomycetaceae bacterium]|nr:hypothetical protein [Planctomycetaceae bacterium]